MHVLSSYDYALIRVVPSVERGECLNTGVILFCRTQRFLNAKIELNAQRLQTLHPESDVESIATQLENFQRTCQGGRRSGPIGELSQSERFHWLVSPRSTILQISPVHSGLCSDPQLALESLFKKMVLL